MPFKRAARRPNEDADDEKNMREAKNRFSLPYYLIIISVFLFALTVGYETYEDMIRKFSVTESQSKTSILDFQKNSCNPFNLTEPCEKILDCVQKERR
jgi:thioredoxin-related protein